MLTRSTFPDAFTVSSLVLLLVGVMPGWSQTAPTVTSIEISFKLDARFTRGTYMGDRWVPSFGPIGWEGTSLSVDARAQGVTASGARTDISASWVPENPAKVAVSGSQGSQVTITVKGAGQSGVNVTFGGVSAALFVTATTHGSGIIVQIGQSAGPPPPPPVSTPPPAPPPLVSSIDAPALARIGTAVNAVLAVSGGVPPYTVTVDAGRLPAGVSLNAAALRVEGSPTEKGNFNLTFRIADSAGGIRLQQWRLSVAAPAPAFDSLSYDLRATLHNPFRFVPPVTGGEPPLSFSIDRVPAGFSLDAATGALSGTPTATGTHTLSMTVSDSVASAPTGRATVILRVAPMPLAIATPAIGAAQRDMLFSHQIAAEGGQPPYTFVITSGALPPGVSMSAAGTISGVPTSDGQYVFTVEARDSAEATAARRYELVVAVPVPAISSGGVVNAASLLPDIAPGAWVSIFGTNLAPASATPRAWRADEIVAGRLPLSLDGVSVRINGKPAAVSWVGPTQLNVQAPDDDSRGTVMVEVTTPGGTAQATAVLSGAAPALFVGRRGAITYAAAVHPDGAPVLDAALAAGARPASPGDIILVYGTGFGVTEPVQPAGVLVESPARLTSDVAAWIGGLGVQVEYAGVVGAGLFQFNLQVPDLPEGDHPITVKAEDKLTQDGLFVRVGNSPPR